MTELVEVGGFLFSAWVAGFAAGLIIYWLRRLVDFL